MLSKYTSYTLLLSIVVVLLVLLAWQRISPLPSLPKAAKTIGGETDAYGCLLAAGYSWCAAKDSCIRGWEQYCTSAAPKAAVFSCQGGKSIQATFYPGDDKFVDLRLSDGRYLSVPRAISASGARYAKADESFIFWNKGDTAFITESGTTTFSDCVSK